jgi:extradiol dioxygenase family protein
MSLPAFHLAFPVTDLEATRKFYVEVLGCKQGREDPGNWIDFDFFGHQIVAHKVERAEGVDSNVIQKNKVDGHGVPIPHFGCVLDWEVFDDFVENIKAHKIKFEIEPCK